MGDTPKINKKDRMAQSSARRRFAHKWIFLDLFLLFVVLVAILYFVGLRYNTTASFPLGFYWMSPIEGEPEIGRLVFVCPPDREIFQEGLRRGYFGHGPCPRFYQPLLKRVVASEGADIQTPGHVVIDGITQKNSRIFPRDSDGRSLAAYEGGILEQDEYLILSDYSASSFDSRYFGPVTREDIIGYARKIFP